MGAALRKPGWRGPNDPPGTCFRAEQTFELYHYWPQELKDVEPLPREPVTVARAISPSSKKSVVSQSSHCTRLKPLQRVDDAFDPEPVDALLAAVMVLTGIEWLLVRENWGDYTEAELGAYFDRILLKAKELHGILPSPSLVGRLKNLLFGEGK